jgi:hypothetical protein
MKEMKGILAILLLWIFGIDAASLYADEYRLKLVAMPNPKEIIEDLKWDESKDTQEPVLQISEPGKEGPSYFVKLEGHFPNKDQTLLFENQKVAMDSDGKFTIEVGVDAEHEEFTISKIDEAGEITQQKGELLFPELEQFKATLKGPSPKKWSISPGLGSVRLTVSGENRIKSDAKEDIGYDVKHGYYQIRGFASGGYTGSRRVS